MKREAQALAEDIQHTLNTKAARKVDEPLYSGGMEADLNTIHELDDENGSVLLFEHNTFMEENQ